MTTAEPVTDLAATLTDHEERLRRVEATLRALARMPAEEPGRPLTDTRLLAPLATPAVLPWPAARRVAAPPPEPDSSAERFVTLGRALAGTAHDLNNLLAVIQGYAELLTEELVGDSRRESAVGIQAAAELAGGVVKQLLSVARPTAGTPPRTDVGLHLTRLERLLKAITTGGAGVRLQMEHGCGAAFAGVVPADLTQVVLNLAVNARDAMPDGGELVVRTATLAGGPGVTADWPAGLSSGGWVEVSVSDTGHGIDPAMQDRLTNPTASDRPTAGLGLMTVGDILARCGGHLLLDSTPGAGTRVRVFLPRV